MKITISEPDGPYCTVIDPGVMVVQIRESYLGVQFITDNGERLSVSMRDSGFELHYDGDDGKRGFDFGWFELKNGRLRSPDKMKKEANNEKTKRMD